MTAAAFILAADPIKPSGSDPHLIAAAVIGIVAIIVLITWLKVHPFLALALGAVGLGFGAGMGATKAVTSFGTGFGSTMTSVGILVGFGAMFAKLLVDSGGADRIVTTIVDKARPSLLPWAMALAGALIGLPMFFEIGVVILIPVVLLVARRSGQPLMRIAIPTLAGLSVMHGLVPPHPGPLVAIGALKANLGLTLAIGLVIAIPTVIICGPLLGKLIARWVDVPAPDLFGGNSSAEAENHAASGGMVATETKPARRPSFGAALSAILVPVVLMLAAAIVDVAAPNANNVFKSILVFFGTPVVALAVTVIYGIFVLGTGARMTRRTVATSLDSALGPIANIVFIVCAGGGLKQVIIDTGIGDVIARAVQNSGLSVLVLAWFVAVLIRVATGSATVAITTAAGILSPLAATLPTGTVALMVLAVGSGSLFLSHVNDAGFWLVKEFLGLSVVQTLKSWTVMESLISVVGLAGTLIAHIFIS